MTTTAMYASKTKFALYQRSWGQSMDRAVIDEDNDRLVDRLVSDLGSRPADFSFVHLSAPDKAGHASGFMGPAYLRAVEQVDRLLGRVREAVSAVPALRGCTNLIVTADHGGRGTHGHSAVRKPDDYRIPFIVSGPPPGPGATCTPSTPTIATQVAQGRRTTANSPCATGTSPTWRPGCSACRPCPAASSGHTTSWM